MMKISPLFIFLILLTVLVIFVIFTNWLPLNNNYEGLITLYKSKGVFDKVNIPFYSSKDVSKLYDSLFFDATNGNLIEINGSTCVKSSTTTTNGNAVSETCTALEEIQKEFL